MDKKYLNDEFDRFFEFPGDDRNTVSSVSAKLFAEHIAYPVLMDNAKLTTERDALLTADVGAAKALKKCRDLLKFGGFTFEEREAAVALADEAITGCERPAGTAPIHRDEYAVTQPATTAAIAAGRAA